MNRPARSRLLVASSAALAIASAALVAGPLDPPDGPITSTYKTLDQVEPRIPITAATTPGDGTAIYKISNSGSYYLTGKIKSVDGRSGIVIAASNVTIDLMGYPMEGQPGSHDAIRTEGTVNNITIRNGTISGWGEDGIDLRQGGAGSGATVENVHVSGCAASGVRVGHNSLVRGCTFTVNGGDGLFTGDSSAVENCVARNNGGRGIAASAIASVRGCSAYNNLGHGIHAESASVVTDCGAFGNQVGISSSGNAAVSNCSAEFNGIGISVGARSVVSACRVAQSAGGATGQGILVGNQSSVLDCTTIANRSHGISAGSHCVIRGNMSNLNGNGGDGAAIHVSGADTRVEGNNCTGSDWGVLVAGAGNYIVRNTCSGNATNWDVAAGNVCYVLSATASGAILGDSGGVGPGTENPHANFTY